MKLFLFIFCAIGLIAPLISQTIQPKISFNEELYDFGKFKEADGKVTHNFEFINTGGLDLIVQNVTASCGCTAPQWTREPIPPGGKGFIAATYDPKSRPGAFRKYVTVISNSNPGNVRLTITGEVTPKPRTIEDDYQHAMGPMRLRSNHFAFGTMKNTQQAEKRLEIVNTTNSLVNIEFERVPKHVTIKAVPAALQPNQKGVLIASYDAPLRNDWGFVIDRMGLKINGVSERNYSLVISANIEEDFASLSAEQLAKAPVLSVDNHEFKFGKINQGEKREHTFVLTNSGKSDLHIRKVKASCGCTAVQPDKNVVVPGESINIKTVFNSAGKVGNQNKTVTIITNDPKKSKLVLWVKGEVVKS
ncbi:MAG: DUF1573 domain-containing protein [Bacteroidetes bacterium]|nr:MAG: DUF1573 domain-containing protein [Bacteroidota bacterium]